MKSPKKGKKADAEAEKIEEKDSDILELAVPPKNKKQAKPVEKGPEKAKGKTVKAEAKDERNVPKVATAKTKRPSPPSSPVRKVKASASTAEGSAKMPENYASVVPEVVGSGPSLAGSDVVLPDPLASMSPVDQLLAQPVLPPLERENRAWLQMQSPTKLHFYWSLRENPWATLRKAFGNEIGAYTLVLKLVELRSEYEQVHNADGEGNWWFDVRPDGEYQAEIGFYAPNRPYIRIIYSNVIVTPSLKPSPRKAVESDWMVSAHNFARVLNVAGYVRDAFDVAVAGDDPLASATAARHALQQFANGNADKLAVVDDEDIRYAMMAFAEGRMLEHFKWDIQPELFDYLQSSREPLEAGRAEAALREHFDLEDVEFESEETGHAVFGASVVNFPRGTRSKRRPGVGTVPTSVSSHSFCGRPGT